MQRRQNPDPATYLGKGKAAELRDIVIAEGADTVICDTELAPSQRRALEDVVKVKVIDRTALILDIFAQHAKSREGKAQVELAQLQYLLPRLRGWGESMSRQAGGQAAGGQGMGSRGPGETKIELDRRRINTRDGQAAPRDQGHEDASATPSAAAAARTGVPSVAIAGLHQRRQVLACSTGSPVPACSSRTSSSRPSTPRCAAPRPRTAALYTLADTVGFVRQLPHQLVEAFRSTLEEVADADLLLHVVDGSHPDPEGQISAVRSVLADVDATDVKEVIVVNKADIADPEVLDRLRRHEKHVVVVSARTGAGLDELRALVADELPQPDVDVDVLVPYDRGDLVSRVHETGEVLASEHVAEGTRRHRAGRRRARRGPLRVRGLTRRARTPVAAHRPGPVPPRAVGAVRRRGGGPDVRPRARPLGRARLRLRRRRGGRHGRGGGHRRATWPRSAPPSGPGWPSPARPRTGRSSPGSPGAPSSGPGQGTRPTSRPRWSSSPRGSTRGALPSTAARESGSSTCGAP